MPAFTIIDELPSSIDLYYIPSHLGKKGIMVSFHGQTAWVGVFADGTLANDEFTGVLSLANTSAELLVLSRGEGYLIDPNKVGSFELLEIRAVTWAKFYPAFNLLIIVTPWEVIAMKDKEIHWETGRIAIDGITIDSTSVDTIKGSVNTLEGQDTFFLDVSTGQITGVSPLPFA